MQVDVRHTLGRVSGRLGELIERRRTAAAIALTRTAQDVRAAEYAEMRKVFSKPTRFTLNSLYLRPATAARLVASIEIKDQALRYLSPQIRGGARQLKRFEYLLKSRGILPAGMAAVPGEGARLNGNGNMSSGQLVQVLSALRALGEQGYMANRTASARSRRSAKRAGDYFAGRPGGGRLPFGVYHRRTIKGQSVLKPVLIFVPTPVYKIRLDFEGVARRVIAAKFHENFVRALQR